MTFLKQSAWNFDERACLNHLLLVNLITIRQRWTRLHIFQAPRSLLPLKHAKFMQLALSLFGGLLPFKLSNIAAFIEYIIGAFFMLLGLQLEDPFALIHLFK